MPSDRYVTTLKYDYIFCGTGASASLLLLELYRKNLLKETKVLLVDQVMKTSRDKTFCFWAEEGDPICQDLKSLISYSWDAVNLSDHSAISILPLKYNHVSSIDLYQELNKLVDQLGLQRLIATVENINKDEEGLYIIADGLKIRGKKIFDSRTPIYQPPIRGEVHLYQSFVGWMIETESEILQPHTFRFMDFEIEQQGFTQFVYVLPFTPNKALVEVTRFGAEVIKVGDAELLLKKYIAHHFGKHTVTDVEQGCIPMSNTKIAYDITPGVVTLGAKNYHIKPSTGYAFKNMYYHAKAVVASIQKGENLELLNSLHEKKFIGRFAFYDSLLLDILKNRPGQGKHIFVELLRNVEIKKILKFLDEKTNIKEDISIFYQLPWAPFLTALFHKTIRYSWFQPLILTILTIFLIVLGNKSPLQTNIANGIFFVGLISVGIPHGAVDHLLETGKWDFKKAPLFIVKYLLLFALMGMIWYFIPPLALTIFIGYSAWHFGQADGDQWQFSPLIAMLWGTSVLFYLLGTHITETNAILATMGQLSLPISCPVWAMLPWLLWAVIRKKFPLMLTVIWLMLASYIPLLYAFGLYFIGQHSLTSWQHIQAHLKLSHKHIWLHALPFHGGAWFLMAAFYFLWPSQDMVYDYSQWGLFFIFIACISFPHVIAMHVVYKGRSNF
jgi:lycopene beta-cyclase